MKELCTNVANAHKAAKSKEVYVTIRKITNKRTTRMQTVNSKAGEVLSELQVVKNRWKENYYNNQNPVNKETMELHRCHLMRKNQTSSENKLLLQLKN